MLQAITVGFKTALFKKLKLQTEGQFFSYLPIFWIHSMWVFLSDNYQ